MELHRPARRPWAWVRLGVLLAVLLALTVVEQARGWDDVQLLRDLVEGAGALGGVVFVAGYALLCLVPIPKAVLTTLGGLLYGLWLGALLSWLAALAGAVLAFVLGRLVGRDAIEGLTQGRVAQADRLLTRHGLGAVVAVRLVPVVPFTAINYAAGLTGVRWWHYLVGSALGMVPGSLAYAALGAWGTDPWGVFVGAAALVVLVVAGGLLGRHLWGTDAGSTAGGDTDAQEAR
ncbi:VTT domain-containing protein [Isoptericola halotolerans]|uniref:TVP38/TMEM64 family protein n=1 Tax=Isoptericola halotolerans TaxID=300560 RepID=UPI00388E1E19